MKATEVNAGLAESNGRLLLGIWSDSLRVTCGLTACTPGSAPGPTLGNEYGKTLPFLSLIASVRSLAGCNASSLSGCKWTRETRRVTHRVVVHGGAKSGATDS